MLNPKLAVFFLTLLPQFIDPGDSTAARSLLLAGIFELMCLTWLLAFTLTVARVREALRSPRATRVVERVTGSVLVAVGLRVAGQRG